MTEETEEAEKKALFLLNSVGEDVKIKALDMLRAISGGQQKVLPEREDGDQVYYNSRGEVEIETAIYLGPNDHRTARKTAYARQVIPVLPSDLAWYGHQEGMPEPLNRRGYLMPQRRAQAPPTFPGHVEDDEDDFNLSIGDLLPSRRRRRRGSSSTETSQHSLSVSAKPGPPKKRYARRSGTLNRRSSSTRQQLQPRLSQSWDPQEADQEMTRNMARRPEKDRAEAAVGFLVATTKSKKTEATTVSRTIKSSDDETSNDAEIQTKQSQRTAIPPAFKAPIANMGTFQPSSTTQIEGKRIKMYAHKSTSSSVPRASTSKGPAAIKESRLTKVLQHQTAAASQDSGPIDQQRPHLPAVKSGRVLTEFDRSAPIRVARAQNPSRAAKKSVLPQRREDVSPPKKQPETPKGSSGEEMVFVPGFHLVEPDWSDEEEDEGQKDKHGDGRLRTTAAQSSRSTKRKLSSPSASISPRKKRSKKTGDEVIRAALRPANQPPPKLQLSPREVKRLGLEGVAELERGKVDRSFDKSAPGYSEHGRYNRYINRTDWSGPQQVKVPYPKHMMRADFYYPKEVPKMKQSTPPPLTPPAPLPPALQRQQQQQQQHMRGLTAPSRHQQQEQHMQRRSMAPTPPRHRHQPQQQQRGASAVHPQPKEQSQIRDDEGVIADNEAPLQATPGPQNPTARGRPGWISGEWMDLARKMAAEDPLAKFFKKKD